MVTEKLPFKERQPHRMLRLMRRGPTFRPGLSPGECPVSVPPRSQLRNLSPGKAHPVGGGETTWHQCTELPKLGNKRSAPGADGEAWAEGPT